MQNNQLNKGKHMYQYWWQCNINQTAMQQDQLWQRLVQNDNAITNSNKPGRILPTNLGKFLGKYYQYGKPLHRVRDYKDKLNAGKGAVQGREKFHAVLGEQVSSSTIAKQLTVLEEKLGEIAVNLRAKKSEKGRYKGSGSVFK